MPRTARIDAPGFPYHVFARGIEKRRIFNDDKDRRFFLKSLGRLVAETGTPLYSFSLMPNHFHLLILRDRNPVSTLMQKLLTGYAIYFNSRHSRVGHLFQNRYKGLICADDTYLRGLVRYIHHNPVRSGLLKSRGELDDYPFTAHSYIIGRYKATWFDPAIVLGSFCDNAAEALAVYRDFMGRPEAGDAAARFDPLEAARKPGSGWSPGKDGDDAARDPAMAAGRRSVRHQGNTDVRHVQRQLDVRREIEIACRRHHASVEELLGGVRRKPVVDARTELVLTLARESGLSNKAISDELGLSKSAVSMILKRAAEKKAGAAPAGGPGSWLRNR